MAFYLFLNGRFLGGGYSIPIISCLIFALQSASWVYDKCTNRCSQRGAVRLVHREAADYFGVAVPAWLSSSLGGVPFTINHNEKWLAHMIFEMNSLSSSAFRRRRERRIEKSSS